MRDQKNDRLQNRDNYLGRPAQQQGDDWRERTSNPVLRPGPITFAVSWLGNAFDRTRINKREAEERRSRNM
jgi:hypothetical protein